MQSELEQDLIAAMIAANMNCNGENKNVQHDNNKSGPPKKSKNLTDSEIARKSKSIMDEYLLTGDPKEALDQVRELHSQDNVHKFMCFAAKHVFERSKEARHMFGELLYDLVIFEVMAPQQYLQGLDEIIQYAQNKEKDLHLGFEYLSQIISPMIKDGAIPPAFLKEMGKVIAQINHAHLLMADILLDAVRGLGRVKLEKIWKESGISGEMFFTQDKRNKQYITGFLERYKLEFTVEPNKEPRSIERPNAVQMQKELNRLIVVEQKENSHVFDWVELNLGGSCENNKDFIRALTTSVFRSAIDGTGPLSTLNTDKLKNRVVLLARYLQRDSWSELQGLFALQALVHSLGHPQGLLRGFFDALYDEDIISEDVFEKWESSVDPAEQTGKDIAKVSVARFLEWMREAAEDNEDY